ncbi:BREX-1 system adenine-specific DNA-methyltransferase PglX [Halobacillus ihumii]|uniref:BREX-1 system adenine-specific DNA-methyltransferase PglX n=1 Tax=Halobacillus ihumii TaxID=2686092 RepID=UPI0013D0DAB1|nr:BREX-1 system adenine-specific DNA-methyltransferase PglX [Halobacillus ihumii]
MNKAELKKFAIEARRELIEKVSLKAEKYGITEGDDFKIEEKFGQLIVDGESYSLELRPAFQSLKRRLYDKGYEQLIDEVAYTWFNRIIAIRYMEVNNYLPDKVNVLSSSTGKNEPDILHQHETMKLDVNHQEVNQWIQKGEVEKAFRKLLIAQCNSLGTNLPILFDKINDYTELLLPEYLLDSESIISMLVNNQELTGSFKEVEVIGWLYQYYNLEPKEKVYNNIKRNKKVTKYEIPAVTQLFTPKWIVKYMVENSLGELWMESNGNSLMSNRMTYYINPADQEDQVSKKIEEIRYKNINLEEISIIDPCVGSGHILVYAFDLLYEMYLEEGYPKKDIPKLIVEKNLYGLDIDERATQLATLALIMKCREKSRRALKDNLYPKIYAIKESNGLDLELLKGKLCYSNEERKEIESLFDKFNDSKNYGSLIKVDEVDYKKYLKRLEELKEFNVAQLNIDDYVFYDQFHHFESLFKQAHILGSTFDVTITNPPYMGGKNTNSQLKSYLKLNYPMTKSDMFAAMMERMESFTKENGVIANVTMQSWMFLSSFEKYRKHLLKEYSICSMVHMESMVMGISFGTVATILRNRTEGYKGVYQYVRYKDLEESEPHKFPLDNNRYSIVSSDVFKNLPSNPIAYWMSEKVQNAFKKYSRLKQIADVKKGSFTGNNDYFLKLWFEVSYKKIGFNINNREESKNSGYKWFPYNKGGSFKKWYGNNEYVINWENDGEELKNFEKFGMRNPRFFFREGITWSSLTSGNVSFRYSPQGSLFDSKGPMIFPKDDKDLYYILALLNSKVSHLLLTLIAPTMDFNPTPVSNIPIAEVTKENSQSLQELVESNIKLAKFEWDSYEESWEFIKHPLLWKKYKEPLLKNSYLYWKDLKQQNKRKMKFNEERINHIFISIYGLQNEINNVVEDKEITILQSDREQETISFLSYFIGCIMGRYSLDIDGLAYAGGEFNESKYQTFKPNQGGLIQLNDRHYFNTDIIVRLREFLSVAFSAETVNENIQWLAESLKMKKNETPEERLRRYFLDEFFKDHCTTYQKRPIYWLIDSGKQKGLRTLIYMHSYQPDTMATIRFEHLQEIQSKYQNEIDMIDTRLANPSLPATDRRNLEKSKTAFQKKVEELQEFDKHLATYANEQFDIDLDDGVKVNYAKFDNVLAKIK